MKTWTCTIVALAAATALAVAGCGGSSGESSGDTAPPSGTTSGEEQTTTPATTAEEAADESEVVKGGILRIGTKDQIPSFNPYYLLTAQQGVAQSMTYPQLVQFSYSDETGYEVAPDLAESWEIAPDRKTVTFNLVPGAQWSDGTPLKAEDAAWTINTTVQFEDGPTGQMVPAIEGIESAEAVDSTTLVVHYSQPILDSPLLMAAALFPVLPKHIWEEKAQGDGRALRTFRPENEPGGLVSGGPFLLKQYEKKGTTVYVPNPTFYGPKPNVEAVALTYYTNDDAMLEDLRADQLDWVDDVPFSAVGTISDDPNVEIATGVTGAQLDLFFNSNPKKPNNRELLDPQVREAFARCIDRDQLIEVIFSGYARPTETLLGSTSGEAANPNLGPRPFDCAEGNRILDELGYARGADGVRVVPGTADQPEHKMAYEIITEANPQWNLDRAVEIMRTAWEELGIDVTQKVAGDETATWEYKTGADCDAETQTGYAEFDLELNLTYPEIDPLSTLSGELGESWCVWNFSGYSNPEYDALYQQALGELDPEKRKEILWEMEEIYYNDLAIVSLVEEEGITAYSKKWADFVSDNLQAYSKTYYTSPHLAE